MRNNFSLPILLSLIRLDPTIMDLKKQVKGFIFLCYFEYNGMKTIFRSQPEFFPKGEEDDVDIYIKYIY